MGIALWIVAGCVAFAVTRPVSIARTGWQQELPTSLVTASALGVVATGLDFGGWNEPDWRAALFAGFGALSVIAVARLMSSARPRLPDPASQNRSKR